MSRLYDTIEPSVIDEHMLKQAVEEQGPRGEAGRIAKTEGIDFGEVLSLRLDFKSTKMVNVVYTLCTILCNCTSFMQSYLHICMQSCSFIVCLSFRYTED